MNAPQIAAVHSAMIGEDAALSILVELADGSVWSCRFSRPELLARMQQVNPPDDPDPPQMVAPDGRRLSLPEVLDEMRHEHEQQRQAALLWIEQVFDQMWASNEAAIRALEQKDREGLALQ